ncbi:MULTISPECIES: serine/threonine-protein kinase [unclassified Paenibacillus]|uniref:serine/threonine protein kinase n=1 Tax=unclassified Paenibacillus TaxID=185978 RepID=UPI002406D16D|nr:MULTISPECIES: serine/threonine-protein kinase [unclassified Paenibacillus]MDF9841083.1 serine/threonine protein kinase [Paenibacillus sp. PastF-2]MDF9847745.1 serine/threonine protein kinase [Paenibacillus sp. PastM-2]MDF9854314.1 serine/threonine protein kinase [Paenibacillus sp. PastF-1]MDH6479515.1 serine/threonine protein kinase [Paenibacillus sp. PastH-2]MDH6505181.1 serine/threonine protein kinase [Paenibacillus sp. PastM-3]
MIYESRLAAGFLLGRRYRIVRKIASGGMSHVYLAEDIRLPGQYWAVKESISQRETLGNVAAEAELLISLNHSLLPRVVDFFPPDEQNYCYLVMDYIGGVTLSDYIKEQAAPLDGEQIASYARQLLGVLHYLHSHHPPIIYRDLKPSNIMLTGTGELRLIDFGIARSYRQGAAEDTEKFGTAGFAAPEQYGSGQSSPVSDLYGLGALMLYMASGGLYSRWEPGMEAKLDGRNMSGLIPVIRRLLRYHPEERYQSAQQVLLALEQAAESGSKPDKRDTRSRLETTSDISVSSQATVVALLGIAAGLGTTHTSLAAASCLARRGKTAWVGFSPDSTVYGRICSLLDYPAGSETADSQDDPVSWKGIDYWPRPAAGNLSSLLEKHYSYIVVDLGTGSFDGAQEVFVNSGIPLLLSSGADWRLEDTLYWLRRSRLTPTADWRICLPLAGHSAAGLLAAALHGRVKVCSLPLQQNPFQRKGKLIHVLDRLLTETGRLHLPVKCSGIFQKKGQNR